jgi:hypothetical protein
VAAAAAVAAGAAGAVLASACWRLQQQQVLQEQYRPRQLVMAALMT